MALVLLIKQIHLITLKLPRPWHGEGQTKGYYAQQEGKKEGKGGHMVHFFVAFAYNKPLFYVNNIMEH